MEFIQLNNNEITISDQINSIIVDISKEEQMASDIKKLIFEFETSLEKDNKCSEDLMRTLENTMEKVVDCFLLCNLKLFTNEDKFSLGIYLKFIFN